MENSKLLIDTSILVEHLRKQNRRKSILYSILDDYDLYVSPIVEFELFMGATDSQKYQDALGVLAWCTSLPLTSATAQQAGIIYRNLKERNQLIEMSDILIAATAVANNLPLTYVVDTSARG